MQTELPTGWKLQAVGAFLSESRLPGSSGNTAEKLTVKLYGGGVHAKKERTAGSANTKYFKRRNGQFIYSKLDFLNGAFGVIPAELDGRQSTTDLPAFDFDHGVSPDWFLYYVSRPEFYKSQGTAAIGSRKARRVNPSELLQMRIPTPPLNEQKKIVSILSSVDQAIQATQAVIEQTRRVNEGLFQELLTKGIGHSVFVDTPQGRIPKSWSISTPGQLASFSGGNGFRPPDWSESGLPIIRIQNLNGSRRFNFYDGPVRPKWLVHPGDLLFAWAGTAGASFGPSLWPGPKAVLNQHIYKVTPNPDVNKIWLYGILKMITARIEQRAHGFKSTLLHVHKSDITDQSIPLPPETEQLEISLRLKELEDAASSSIPALDALQRTKAGLLQDLLSGKVRVSP